LDKITASVTRRLEPGYWATLIFHCALEIL